MQPSPVHNVGAWTTRRAAIRGEQLALVDADRALDYAAFHARTQRCAALLRGAGLQRGERVALLLGNRTAYLEVVMAAARLGAIAVPINARLTAREVRVLLDDCAPRLLLHEASLAEVAGAACAELDAPPARIVCPEAYERHLAEQIPDDHVEPVTPDHPMILMYTSGTTGVPKGALLPHRKTLFNCLNAQLFFDLTHHDRVLVVLPLFHSFGLSILSLPTLYAGGSIHLEARFDPEATWDRIAERRITFMGAVPTQFRAMLDVLEAAPRVRDTGSLRFLFSAGAPIAVEQIRAFERHGLLLKQGFGQTETSILCCLDARDAVRKAGSVGRPVFHAEIRVVALDTVDGETGTWRDVEPGETGEIVVRGPITMLGYWRRPEETAETLRGEWLRTLDLASVDAEGFLTLVGRARELYISGGENVYPAEIESVYQEHPDVRDIAVVGVPDAKWGEVGRAYVVLARDARFDAEALRRWGTERLADFKLPRSFVAVDALPRTETGKVQKHRLGAEEGAKSAGAPEVSAQ
ncbi:MAG: AMP-binding protein [Myxococcales bacterium]|nr:AMP-binding protein [Myxococcales bacterium]